MNSKFRLHGIASTMVMVLVSFAMLPGKALAQADAAKDFPNRTLRLVVPLSAGGGNDIFARVLGQNLSEIVKQPVVIDNKPGANGIIGTEFVAKASPDGYTLLVAPTGMMISNPAVYAKLPYDTKRDFAPITMISEFPLILVVNGKSPIKSVRELVSYAKINSAKANYASQSVSFQLLNEMFKLRTGSPAVNISYKGGHDILMAVTKGEVLYGISDSPPAFPLIKSGQVQALAVGGSQRWPELPNVPTFEEAGVKDANFRIWSGLFAPTATPPAILAKLHAAATRALKAPDLVARFKKMRVEPAAMSREEFARIIDEDLRQSIETARALNITM